MSNPGVKKFILNENVLKSGKLKIVKTLNKNV